MQNVTNNIHTYKFICILLCTHVYVNNHTYIPYLGIQRVVLIMWDFSLSVLQSS